MQLFIVDEANFIPPNCYDGLLPHAQKRGGKLIFTSSSASAPVQEKAITTNLDVLRETHGVLFATLTYVCNEHIEDFVAQTNRTTCNCFMHLEPLHVDNSTADRTVADKLNEATGRDIGYLLDRGVSHTSLIARGIEREQLPLLRNSTICHMLENVQNTHAMAESGALDTRLFVYVDTCAHLSSHSKNGISVCSRYRNENGNWDYNVLAVDHCHNASSTSQHISMFHFVAELIVNLLTKTCSLHPKAHDNSRSHFSEAFLVIECNSYDLTETIQNLHWLLVHKRPPLLYNVQVKCLYHETVGHAVFSEQVTFTNPLSHKSKTCNIKPGFIMDLHKSDYFKKVFDIMAMGSVTLSQFLTSIYVQPNGNQSLHAVVIEHLSRIQALQKGNRTIYKGTGKYKQDDLALSVIMSIYIALDSSNSMLDRKRYMWKDMGS